MLFLTACGTNQENEITEVTGATEVSKVDASGQIYTIEGILLSDEPPMGPGIKLNTKIEVTRQWNDETYTFDSVYFSGDEIYNYVDRDKFLYDDPFILLKEDSNIPVKIKFDFSGFIQSEGIIEDEYIWTDKYEILEVNGSSDLIDKSDEPYPFSQEIEE